MKLPQLMPSRFNKRANAETSIIRVYKTLKGDYMYFMVINQKYHYLAKPYSHLAVCSFYPQRGNTYISLVEFQARICGLTMGEE